GSNSPTEPALQATVESASAAVSNAAGSTAGETSGTLEDGPGGRRVAARRAASAGDEAAAATAAATESRVTAAGHGHGNGGNGGNGGGNGNGNGNGGNNGNRGGDLRLEMQPNVWNTNFEHAGGTVSALVRGGDAAKIDKASVKLVGDGGGSVTPTRVQLAGGQLRAFFLQSEAIKSLDDPDPGETHDVKLQFTVAGTAKELTDTVRIVGPRNDDGEDDPDDPADDEVDLFVQPNAWNVNWAHANGTVSVLLRGDVGDVALDSIVLVGDKATDNEVQPVSVKRTGHQVRARFAMAAAFNSLDDPDSGETHTVKVKYTDGGTAKELTATVRIVGP
ncbi:MAG TPA: hypothetical protein VN923_06340, partial [Thermoanaerobaculia bacterium]|nr:hypothetical protein [Thermoanaerobaculia bacterium]